MRFDLRTGQEAVISYASWDDIRGIREFINTVSKEDTYVTLSGEQFSLEEEITFVSESLKQVELGDGVYLVCKVEGRVVGVFTVFRNKQSRKREMHVGTLGLIVAENFRNQGIGKQLMQIGLEEVKRTINDIHIVVLTVFASNEYAHRLYTRFGFREYGRLPRGIYHKDRFVDHIYMYKRLSE